MAAAFLAAGVVVTWPRAYYLVDHRLPATRDAAAYVWGFWWVARQVGHLGNPWFTRYLAAPAGAPLALHVLMPLEGVLMAPVTAVLGPSASYNLLSAAAPGLSCYAAYRVGRLWLSTRVGAITAGALYGLSPMLSWRAWYHLNLAVGAVFLPLAAEAAVRLRRHPSRRHAVILGLIMAASLLTDQESTVMAAAIAALVLLPWLAHRPHQHALKLTGLAVGVAIIAGSPQLAAVAWQASRGGATPSPALLTRSYTSYGTGLYGLFAPSPRIADIGLTSLAGVYYHDGIIYQSIPGHSHIPASEPTPMFGVTLPLLALTGLALSWRRRSARHLSLLWFTGAALALGPVLWVGSHAYAPAAQTFHGAHLSTLMPYTWFIHIPGLSGFREPNRLAELGLLPAALLAGAATQHLRCRISPRLGVPLLSAIAAAAVLEVGWPGNLPAATMPSAYRVGTMPTALPALDHPIGADRTGSIVVDFPYGICGGIPTYGAQYNPLAQLLATADHHPRAIAFLARTPSPTLTEIQRQAFYTGLLSVWRHAAQLTPGQLAAARSDVHAANIGWVLIWPQHYSDNGRQVTYYSQGAPIYLRQTGFHFAYEANGVLVYRVNPPTGTQ